jgi:hypothetical protein
VRAGCRKPTVRGEVGVNPILSWARLAHTHAVPPPNPLTGSQLRTFERIFQHPITHNLSWHDVFGMFRQLGTVETEANGNIKVTRNGQVMILKASQSKDVGEADEVMALRRFIKLTEAIPSNSDGAEVHWLLVIDHHRARLFRTEMSGSVPKQILPHEPTEYFRQAHHSRDFSRGKEKPDPNTFFEPVAKELMAGGQILIFGSGTGESSEMQNFAAWLREHHPEISRRVLGTIVVDESHVTDGQLLKKAREFFEETKAASVANP